MAMHGTVSVWECLCPTPQLRSHDLVVSDQRVVHCVGCGTSRWVPVASVTWTDDELCPLGCGYPIHNHTCEPAKSSAHLSTIRQPKQET